MKHSRLRGEVAGATSVGEPILLSQEQISEARPRLLAYARRGR